MASLDKNRRLIDVLLIAAFLAAIASSPVARIIDPTSGGDASAEMRRPAPPPARPTDWFTFSVFPRDFEAFYGDSFGLRARLIRWHNAFKLFVLKVTPSEEILLGKDGWLFTARSNSAEVFRGVDPFTEVELEAWQRMLEGQHDWCAARGMRYCFAIAPNKNSIYPERMPSSLTRVGPTRLEQLLPWMEKHSHVRVLDLRPAMLAAKPSAEEAGQELYYPLGTHWNRRGMLVGFVALMEHIAPELPRLVVPSMEDFRLVPASSQGDSWAERLYMGGLLFQRNEEIKTAFEPRARPAKEQPAHVPVTIMEVDDPALPSAVMFHDSFGNMEKSLLAEHFRRIAFYYDHEFDEDFVAEEAPDVVICQYIERSLFAALPARSPLDGDEKLAAEFAKLETVLGKVVAPTDLTPVERRVLVEAEPDGLRIRTGVPGFGVLLPSFELPAGHLALLRLELESPARTQVRIEFMTPSHPEYSLRAAVAKRWLEPGTNTVYIKLLTSDLLGRLRLSLGPEAEQFLLRSLEVRASPD